MKSPQPKPPEWSSLLFPMALPGGYPAIGIVTLTAQEWSNLRSNWAAQTVGAEGPTEVPIQVIGPVIHFQDPAPDAVPIDACSIPLRMAQTRAVRTTRMKAPRADILVGEPTAQMTADNGQLVFHWRGYTGMARSPWLPAPALSAGPGWSLPLGD
jgi:hypothetical protein